MTERAKPTEQEALILLQANKDYYAQGSTGIRCPRCGKPLEYRCDKSFEEVYCTDEKCISVGI